MKNNDDKIRVRNAKGKEVCLRYFGKQELARVTHPTPGTDPESDPAQFYSPELLLKLDDMRHSCGVVILLNSGYRCASYNAKVGGSATSSHVRGYAMDISCTDPEHRYLYLRAALAVGFTRIGIGHTFLHLDIDPDKTQHCIWHY